MSVFNRACPSNEKPRYFVRMVAPPYRKGFVDYISSITQDPEKYLCYRCLVFFDELDDGIPVALIGYKISSDSGQNYKISVYDYDILYDVDISSIYALVLAIFVSYSLSSEMRYLNLGVLSPIVDMIFNGEYPMEIIDLWVDHVVFRSDVDRLFYSYASSDDKKYKVHDDTLSLEHITNLSEDQYNWASISS